MKGGGECVYDGSNYKDDVNTILLVVAMMMMMTRTMVTMKTTSNIVVA